MVKNITLSLEETLIKKARRKAQKEHSSLNSLFREWVKNYVNIDTAETRFDTIMATLDYAKPGKKFTRDQMNER